MVGIDFGGIEIWFFIFGGLLLLIGILGGGFEVKELKIPKVGSGPRILASLVGIIFIFAALGIMEPRQSSQPAEESGNIDFAIYDSLGEGEVSEQVTVVLDGKVVGTLTINKDYPNSWLKVTVSKPGQHSYHVESAAVFDVGGELKEYYGVGQGMINVEKDKKFSLASSFSGNTWLVTMVDGYNEATAVATTTAVSRFTTATTSSVKIDQAYLVGTWIFVSQDKKTSMGWTFSSNGKYIYIVIDNTGETSSKGSFTVTNNELKITDDQTGKTEYLSLSYIDRNSFEMEKVVFERTILPTSTQTSTSIKLTYDFLDGLWAAETTGWSESISFGNDGYFGEASTDKNTNQMTTSGGSYTISGSNVDFKFDTGTTKSYTIIIINENTIELGNVEYTRKIK